MRFFSLLLLGYYFYGPGVVGFKTCFKSYDIFYTTCDTAEPVVGLIYMMTNEGSRDNDGLVRF